MKGDHINGPTIRRRLDMSGLGLGAAAAAGTLLTGANVS